MDIKKEEKLIDSVENFYATVGRVVDVVYNLIDGECEKNDIIPVMSKLKEHLAKLEKTLKEV